MAHPESRIGPPSLYLPAFGIPDPGEEVGHGGLQVYQFPYAAEPSPGE